LTLAIEATAHAIRTAASTPRMSIRRRRIASAASGPSSIADAAAKADASSRPIGVAMVNPEFG
jgi:hypothetical protein